MNYRKTIRRLVFLSLFAMGGITIQAQSVTKEFKETPLSGVLKEVEKQTGFSIMYNNDDLSGSRAVTRTFEDASIEEVLKAVLPKNLEFKLQNKMIVIFKKGSQGTQQKQVKKVTGIIVDAAGEPVIGANVLVKGTTNGVITDIDGNYTLNDVPADAIISISYIGYQPLEFKADSKELAKVMLKEDSELLDEVVVVGYGTMKKTDLTGSVSSIHNEAITEQGAVNVSQALRGQIPGLSITQSSGKAFSESTVILRGQSSIGKTVQPLVVIDGMTSDFGVLNSLNPNDIERIDVLKDASSTAIYGSRASGGVIIVTTKEGTSSKNVISYEGTVGVRTMTHMPEMMNTQDLLQLTKDRGAYNGQPYTFGTDEEEYIQQGINTDWIDLVTRNGLQTSHNVSLTGGGKNESHLMSIGYYKTQGNLKSDEYERYTLNLKVTGKIFEKVTAGASAYAVYSNEQGGDGSIFQTAFYSKPWGNPYNDDGSVRTFPIQLETRMANPLADIANSKIERRRYYVNASAFIEYKPFEFLTFKSNFMPAFYGNRFGTFIGENTTANGGVAGTSTAEVTNTFKMSYVWDNTVSFQKQIGDHGINVVGLFSVENTRVEDYSSEVRDLQYAGQYWYNQAASTSILGVGSGLEDYAMLSYMLRANYNYKDRYMFTVTGRMDGSSKLADGNKWAFFPSVAVSWRISEEQFMKSLDFLSNLKLRLSYGTSGNNAVSPYSSWSRLNTKYYDFDGQAAIGAAASMGNKNLSWEKSYEYNLGLDFGFLDQRISGSVDLYHKTSKDIIMSRKIASHQGITSLSDNVSSVLNKGIELSLSTINIRNKDFEWRTDFNFAMNHNEILTLYDGYNDDVANKWFIGEPVSVNYDYKFVGIWQQDEAEIAQKYSEKPGMVKRWDKNNDNKFNPDDYVILGSPFPKWTGGMTNSFIYKNFDLSFFIYTRQGIQVLSGFHNENNMRVFEARYNMAKVDYWTPERPSNRWWAPSTSGGTYTSYADASFWRVGNITLGYNFDNKKLSSWGLSKLRIYCSVNNPFLFTKYEGWDPEWAEANATDIPMSSTTYLAGINISF